MIAFSHARAAALAALCYSGCSQATASQGDAFRVVASAAQWNYIESGAGSGSPAFPSPRYQVRVPVWITASAALPLGKDAPDYVLNAWAPNLWGGGGSSAWAPNPALHDTLFLSNISPRGQQAEVEVLLQRPGEADSSARTHKLEALVIPTEVSGRAARPFRWVASDGSAVQLELARRLEDGRYEVSVSTQTPPQPRDASSYFQMEVREGGTQGPLLLFDGSANTNANLKDDSFRFFFRPAPGPGVESMALAPTITRRAATWATPHERERHRLILRIPPLDPARCVDGADLLRELDNAPTSHLYRGRGGARSIQVATSRANSLGSSGRGPWQTWLRSFLHDPRPDPGARWRIREVVLRDGKRRTIQREGWPLFWPREYNHQGLPLRAEFYGQEWQFFALSAARNASTMEVRWAPVAERLVTARFGPFDVTRAVRTQRLTAGRELGEGTLSLRAWQLPPAGASRNLNNERQPLALWFSYAARSKSVWLQPTSVDWEDEGGRRPASLDDARIEAWNLARRRPRRPGEADATAWRSQHAPPAQDAQRLWLVVRGIERRVTGAAFSSLTPAIF